MLLNHSCGPKHDGIVNHAHCPETLAAQRCLGCVSYAFLSLRWTWADHIHIFKYSIHWDYTVSGYSCLNLPRFDKFTYLWTFKYGWAFSWRNHTDHVPHWVGPDQVNTDLRMVTEIWVNAAQNANEHNRWLGDCNKGNTRSNERFQPSRYQRIKVNNTLIFMARPQIMKEWKTH